MLLLRVELPDRPGALGQVATAMGGVGADISAIEIVERRSDGHVIDDFILAMPPGSLAETIINACAEMPDVKVLWLSRYPDQWNLESDIEVINRMSKQRARAAEILTEDAPTVFRCEWASLVDRKGLKVLHATERAPEFTADQLRELGDLAKAGRHAMGEDWMPDWGDVAVAAAPVDEDRTLLVGRQGGPEFLDSELFRLEHLASVARA
ncbi:amino acid-binding protein [Propionibacterium freudenreichii]|uniref:Amino acid-binding ACT n=3 Tax=Propionibacterium freudenreichii TaxID=1744 RepID=D7GDI6_PROFC|nr:amino acid-binding protein [Propionibacterium freudenreichii]MDN5961327.1 amino acid-binding protein [Propionibacterium sp.]AWY95847.1 Amino acid-binding ACT domain protein [Propionibacterium freudenreichii]MCQ1998682.1 amino acid-binding protein [Propionibacterium freudenreichii]MCT2974030.1 amino acid-binding protein [Propionibacterium freudenreichii]MCT2975820.1 amino acid-binding protein [Propionibacterium freudenreichii]